MAKNMGPRPPFTPGDLGVSPTHGPAHLFCVERHAARCAVAHEQGLRGIVLEAQTNNLAACRFYQAMGFKLCGLDDHFYSNDDMGAKEVAIFWWYELLT